MGTIQHNVIIVTGWDEAHVHLAHETAKRIEREDTDTAGLPMPQKLILTDVKVARYNGYCSFAILPDGSNEGGEPSELHDSMRAELKAKIEILNKTPGVCLEVTEVSFGELGESINGKPVDAAWAVDAQAEHIRSRWFSVVSENHRLREENKRIRNAAGKQMQDLRNSWREETDQQADEIVALKLEVQKQKREFAEALDQLHTNYGERVRTLENQAEKYRQETHRWASETRKLNQKLEDMLEAKHMIAEERDEALAEIRNAADKQTGITDRLSIERDKKMREAAEWQDEVCKCKTSIRSLENEKVASMAAIKQLRDERDQLAHIKDRLHKDIEALGRASASKGAALLEIEQAMGLEGPNVFAKGHSPEQCAEIVRHVEAMVNSFKSDRDSDLKEENEGLRVDNDVANRKVRVLATALRVVRKHIVHRFNGLLDRARQCEESGKTRDAIELRLAADRAGKNLLIIDKALEPLD
jgi:hypothetical protein